MTHGEDLSFHHHAVSVPDIEAAATWYADLLGFGIESRFALPGDIQAMFLVRGPLRIELFEVPSPQPMADDRRDPRRDLQTLGHKHICFRSEDYDRIRSRLKLAGIAIILEVGSGKAQGFFFNDIAGNVIEILR
ncbi:VOC family protein [Blastomonas sp.]|uniref:VOC family protein n=1 Tax=Blastomonas sp. TaxID=1909299 RepID=UPI00391AA7AE